MTVEQAIERLEDEFHRKYPGYQEARDRVDRAHKAYADAKAEVGEALAAMGGYSGDDEYLLMSIRGCREALGMKP
jgi:hypothetical protein